MPQQRRKDLRRMLVLLLQIAVILAMARVARQLMVPIGQPPVIGEMVAGLLLGPSFFGWLMPSASAALFDPSTLAPLNAVSQVGLVLFMFFVGVRVDIGHLKSNRRVAGITSIASIIVPFVLGAWLASVLHARLAPPRVGTVPFALFFGAAMSITAFPVLARILIDRQLIKTELGVIAITCAAFDDVTGWLILAAITTFTSSDGAAMPMTTRLLLLGCYLAVMLMAVKPGLQRFASQRAGGFGRSPIDLVVLVLIILASAIATQLLGVHALFGAFFAGLVMPHNRAFERVFEDRVEGLTTTLLVPLFFAFTGLRTNLQLLADGRMWTDAAVILAFAVVGKAGASTLAARAMGVPWRHATMLGTLLNTRGLIELVVLNIGLDLGILSREVFAMLVLMALITTVMTSPIVARLQRNRAADESRAIAADDETGAL